MKISYSGIFLEAGCDESGRGCLAGPVYAAAVILPKSFQHKTLNDSKKLSARQRNELRSFIEAEAYDYAVSSVSPQEIDEINILNASIKAMHLSITQLKSLPEFLIIDGNRFKPFHDVPHQCLVGGDGKYSSIAAASILSKTYRDDYMLQLDQVFPGYGWARNKGYATYEHRSAIRKYGQTIHHRESFNVKIA